MNVAKIAIFVLAVMFSNFDAVVVNATQPLDEYSADSLLRKIQKALPPDVALSISRAAEKSTRTPENVKRELSQLNRSIAEYDTWLRDYVKNVAPAIGDAVSERFSQTYIWDNSGQVAEINAARRKTLARLNRVIQGYGRFAATVPIVDIWQIREALKPSEGIFLIDHNISDEAEVFFITDDIVLKKNTKWGKQALQTMVTRLRCGLDETMWAVTVSTDGSRPSLTSTCSRVFGRTPRFSEKGEIKLEFDHTTAHDLYLHLFADFEEHIGDRELVFVSSGPLAQLPPHVLITEEPKSGSRPKWLIDRHPVFSLPSLSAFVQLRGQISPSAGDIPYLGFGNPILTGQDESSPLAKLTRRIHGCSSQSRHRDNVLQTLEALRAARAGVSPVLAGSRQLSIPKLVRAQTPLPETAIEICDSAELFGVRSDAVYLGAFATESYIKKLSNSFALSRARVLHFATHAVVAGELLGVDEPGLLLTPFREQPVESDGRPVVRDDGDNGFLSLSEIAQLQIDADLIILSACNTGSGSTRSSQPLAGFANSFFLAGARALLVSNWKVDSEAAVRLVREFVRNRQLGQRKRSNAHALQQAILSLINSGTRLSEPSNWAPFVYVGG